MNEWPRGPPQPRYQESGPLFQSRRRAISRPRSLTGTPNFSIAALMADCWSWLSTHELRGRALEVAYGPGVDCCRRVGRQVRLDTRGKTLFASASPLTAADTLSGSSVVEQPAVNRLVAGSNPARGAKQNQTVGARSRGRQVFRAAAMAAFCKFRRGTTLPHLKGGCSPARLQHAKGVTFEERHTAARTMPWRPSKAIG